MPGRWLLLLLFLVRHVYGPAGRPIIEHDDDDDGDDNDSRVWCGGGGQDIAVGTCGSFKTTVRAGIRWKGTHTAGEERKKQFDCCAVISREDLLSVIYIIVIAIITIIITISTEDDFGRRERIAWKKSRLV